MSKAFFSETDEKGVRENCSACHKKGKILVRMLENERGEHKTMNRINMCENPDCFRFLAKIPTNWKHDIEHEIEVKRRARAIELRHSGKS